MKRINSGTSVLRGSVDIRRLALGLVFSAVVISLAMFVPTRSALAQLETITIAVEGEPTRLDPHTHALWLTYRVVYHMFETFVQPDLTRDDVDIPPIVPALAKDWTISDDGKVYTFELREGVKFHDGAPWNAQAAKFNLDRLLDTEFEYHFPDAVGINGWWLDYIESYEVVDDFTFRITLKKPVANFLQRLANGGYGSAGMVSPAAIEEYGNQEITNHPVGTGPFKFVERVFGEKIVLEKNADYWDPDRTPKYDRLIFRPIAEDPAREVALVSGSADLIATPSPDSVAYLKDQGFEVISKTGPNVYLLWLNMREPLLQDASVRRAMYMAIDREGLCNLLRLGDCIPHYGILHIHGPGYDSDFQPYPYDPEQAKELLTKAGYPDGIDIRFEWSTGGAGASGIKEFVEWVQRDFGKVGIRTELVSYDIGTYFDQMLKGMREGTHLMTLGWGETSYIWLDFLITPAALPPNGYNAGYYDNPKMAELLDKVNAADSEEAQITHLRTIRDIVAEDVPWIPVYSQRSVFAVSPNIKGFVLAPEHWQDFAILDKE